MVSRTRKKRSITCGGKTKAVRWLHLRVLADGRAQRLVRELVLTAADQTRRMIDARALDDVDLMEGVRAVTAQQVLQGARAFPILAASYRLTTRASSARSFKRGGSAVAPVVPVVPGVGACGGVCAQSGGANSAVPNAARLVQKRDRLIREPPKPGGYGPGMVKSRPGLSVRSNSSGEARWLAAISACTWRAAPPSPCGFLAGPAR